MMGANESTAPVPSHVGIGGSPAIHLLQIVKTKLKQLSRDGRKFNQEIKASLGDCTSQGSFDDIWERYANSLDTDAARKSWAEATRLAMASFAQKESHISDDVADLAGILEEINLESMIKEEDIDEDVDEDVDDDVDEDVGEDSGEGDEGI